MPYLPETRQYRNFAASNFRAITREDGDESSDQNYVVKGHFTTFEDPYELWPGYFETIDRHALDETDMSDVLFQFDHCGMVLARIRNDSLQVGTDPDGGWARADLSGCQQARDLYEAITNGLIDRMSFGFTIAEGGFEWEEDPDGNIRTRITKIAKLFDVSAVDLPANDGTDISARSLRDSIMEARDKARELRSQADADKEERDAQPAPDATLSPEIEGFDLSDLAERVADIIAERSAQTAKADEPVVEADGTQGDEDPGPELVEEALRRRKRRMRALQLISI